MMKKLTALVLTLALCLLSCLPEPLMPANGFS